MDSELWNRITRRQPLISVGKSGSQLERGWLDDGRRVVIKHASAGADWIMQATHDNGRVADLWEQGVFDRLPARIEHATLDVRRTADGAEVLMSDASASLLSEAPQLRAGHADVLRAASMLHDAFASTTMHGLCDLRDYYSFLSPGVCERFSADHAVPSLALEGWARFHDLVPPDVVQAVDDVHTYPMRLVEGLLRHEATLVHGDLKMANLGIDAERVVMLDWGTLTAWAPAAVDYAWYVAINGAALELDHGTLLEQCRRAAGPSGTGAFDLALLGALAQLGWEKALGATSDDPAIREKEMAGLAWWVERARSALAQWPM